MKQTLTTVLVVIWIQLWTAQSSPVVEKRPIIRPPNDKRYQLFNFIATKTNEAASQELIARALTIYKILQEGNLFLESQRSKSNYDSQAHKDLKHDLALLKRSLEELKEDQHSCDLQLEVDLKISLLNSKYDEVKIRNLINFEDKETMEKFKSVHDEYTRTALEEFQRLLEELYDQLPQVIANFLESLNESELDEHEALVKWCEDFVAAASIRQKYFIFQRFATFYLEEEALDGSKAAEITDCKWEKTRFEEFIHKMLIWAQPPVPFI